MVGRPTITKQKNTTANDSIIKTSRTKDKILDSKIFSTKVTSEKTKPKTAPRATNDNSIIMKKVA